MYMMYISLQNIVNFIIMRCSGIFFSCMTMYIHWYFHSLKRKYLLLLTFNALGLIGSILLIMKVKIHNQISWPLFLFLPSMIAFPNLFMLLNDIRNNPNFGFISPNIFIPTAEKSGQIFEIGEWTFSTACSQIKVWTDAGYNLKIAINVSLRHCMDENLIPKIDRIIKETNIQPHILEFEIAESSVMDNPEIAIRTIDQLNEIGVTFSIDDFETGYSSLSYLK